MSKSYSVTKLDINSNWSDISPVILPNGLIFVSNREDEMAVSRSSSTHSEPLYKIYFAEKGNKGYKKATKLTGEVNGDFSEGPISFSSDKNVVFFTRNTPLEKTTREGKKASLGIYSATYNNGQIQDVKPFPFNRLEFSLAHPSISSNGNFIIFASNLPGGFGGSDLYVSYLKNDKWEKPINLGKEINTPYNEVFPFIDSSGKLFFSSNGHNSQGGLDIFSANYQNFEWREVRNLGSPFNSSSDDFGYTEDPSKKFGFFSSDRDGRSRDDIFRFEVSQFAFSECDTLKELNYCRTFYEESTVNTDSLPLMYEWDFGHGVKIRGLEANHCFEKPGVYKINLNIIDLITNELYMNEASYDIEILPIRGPYFSLPDTIASTAVLDLDASKSFVSKAYARDFSWDLGDGSLTEGKVVTHAYKTNGDFNIRLGVNFVDSTNSSIFSECVIKPVKVLDPSYFNKKKKTTYKPYYQIRDKKGNTYKIQLATSTEKLNQNAYYFKEIGKVEEYYDREVFGYTVGNFDNIVLCYPELKKVREKGFKEAVIIAMKENKVVSGNDSSFFVKLPNNFKFVRVVSMHGKVMDHNGRPVQTTIKLEDLNTGILLDEFQTDKLTGKYKIDLPVDKAYAYYIYQNGFFPFSNFIDLTKQNDLSEIRSDIYLMGLDKMRKDSLSMRVNNIFFVPGEATLKPESEFELKRLSAYFKLYPNTQLIIDSHTDNLGDKYSKVVFSQKRAQAVKDYMVANGCDTELITIRAFGESKPLTLNPKMQPINNRIEMRTILAK